ncbi:hypothetical protein GQ55_7G075700 [Panicum hallii var. hallii]|uniref:Vps72/YL1 C-terminal domain-containing protein n=1 Tax=Panicum hallii var. hallii TaxID=1504633 RepID=A0A2T7CSV6_9POAL|nr:hypothetical protein GQ55_7G075700 [Panicum hallii var. hallii]
MESEVVRTEMVLAPSLPFKKVQTADKYPKGQSRGRQWKHLRHLLQAADASTMPPDRPNYLNIQSPPSIYPSKRYCDITGFEYMLLAGLEEKTMVAYKKLELRKTRPSVVC